MLATLIWAIYYAEIYSLDGIIDTYQMLKPIFFCSKIKSSRNSEYKEVLDSDQPKKEIIM